jgi:hypothetical protein
MAERGFGEPSRSSDREEFDAMEARVEEHLYREEKLFGVASLLMIANLIVVIAGFIILGSRG